MSLILTKWWLFYKNSMRKVIFFIALVFSIVPLFAENASNVRVEQKGYRGDTVVITYDLSVKATIKLLMSTDMSNDFKELTKVVGDVGKELVAGSNYTIIWLPLLEYERFYADDVRFKVEAVTQSPLQVSTSQLTTSASAATGRMAGHEYVDLGLSVKWATCNIGASRPEDYGDYFAWGETRTKSDYSWNTYKWGSGEYSLSKYITQSKYGRVDNKTILESSDDAARVKWGAPWRMPTMEEMEELCNNCTWKWTTQNGVKGYRVTARNGNSIFLPAGGNMFSNSQFDTNEGWYWLRSLTTGSYPDCAYNMKFTSGKKGDTHYCTRTRGCNIRPVCP